MAAAHYITYYTPVNELLTTAKFCGLYGHWYPHHKSNCSFFRNLICECKVTIRPTALARLIRILTKPKVYYHPVLETEGWCKRKDRVVQYSLDNVLPRHTRHTPKCQPVLIIGKSGTLGSAFSKICEERNIHHILLSLADLDITDRNTVELIIEYLTPWAIINVILKNNLRFY